jgi:O-6-methylguanine DNA methyltransferase
VLATLWYKSCMKHKVRTAAGDIVIDAARTAPADADLAVDLIARHLAVPTPKASPFFERCWKACRSIPAGETRTYGWLAKAAGNAQAVRAAGQAMRRNPLPVIVPCHRVVGANGLGGFAGSDDPRGASCRLKAWLLRREGWTPTPSAKASRHSALASTRRIGRRTAIAHR